MVDKISNQQSIKKGKDPKNLFIILFFLSISVVVILWQINTIKVKMDKEVPVLPLFVYTQINSGTVTSSVNGVLSKGEEGRQESFIVPFDNPYPVGIIPKVVAQLKTLDIDNTRVSRINVETSHISNLGFTLTFKTWSNTIVYFVQASYIAHAEQTLDLPDFFVVSFASPFYDGIDYRGNRRKTIEGH
ncbi:hypothetical protein DFA_07873 [Cavenderia fasciculata]|uniref:H-type lectin domain-containing protein n=1 Tax=Cavenderia fasciculata TaxID=261658 RepID=F4Q3S6_CACFS|nr:uncharacterized protein DFA_07873 [Cavenderia fasciculata]EGG16892.1 hypothetical protein DFA_07873 [Cavenderia fasciculata]|eukprot:XP_004355366.1 hypothetical protein DFA_07873 [Cavenderia fasciculata]